MDELHELNKLPSAFIPDDETRARLRSALDQHMVQPVDGKQDGNQPSERRGRRSVVTTVLVAAGFSISGIAAAAGIGHLWTHDRPVVLPKSGPGPGSNDPVINDPEAMLLTAAAFEATVSEFAPDIRLPEGHDFSAWVVRIEATTDFSKSDGAWRRVTVPETMVFVARCQWSQQWLDAQASANAEGVGEAVDVMSGINQWSETAGVGGSFVWLTSDMRADDVADVRQFVGVNCGGTGALTGTPDALDSVARAELATGFDVARSFAADHGSYAGFNDADGEAAAPATVWLSSRNANPAAAGMTNIEVAEDGLLLLTQESETGTVFCIEDLDGQVTHGEVPAEDVAPLHQPGPGSFPETRCIG